MPEEWYERKCLLSYNQLFGTMKLATIRTYLTNETAHKTILLEIITSKKEMSHDSLHF